MHEEGESFFHAAFFSPALLLKKVKDHNLYTVVFGV